MKDEKNFSPFYFSFLRLCKRDSITPTKAAKLAEISSGAPTAWKRGAIPRPEQLRKLCALFNVSEKELLGYFAEKKPATPEGGGLRPIEIEIMDMIKEFSEQELISVKRILSEIKGLNKNE